MKVYAENDLGQHLFYVEIYNCEGYGNFIECSLPETIFILSDVMPIARRIFRAEYKSSLMLKYLDELIILLKSKKELTCYYFKPVELRANGKFNTEQSNVMHELFLEQNLPKFEVVSIYLNPFLFRFICKEILTFDKSKLKTISKTSYYESLLEENQFTEPNSNNYNQIVEYKIQDIKIHGLPYSLYIKYYGEHPFEFHFH